LSFNEATSPCASTVIERDGEILTLRFRDYPRQPKFQRHISQVALINPGPEA